MKMKPEFNTKYYLKQIISIYKDLWSSESSLGRSINDGDHNNNEISNNNNDQNNEVSLRRKLIKRGALISILTFVMIWWIKRKKGSLMQYILGISRGKSSGNKQHNNINDHRSAMEAPLPVLLAAAKKGSIVKALINSNSIAYQLSYLSSNESSSKAVALDNHLQRWKKTTLPKDNPKMMKEIMDDIAEGGCLDISVLPEPLISRLGPVFITAFPFLYLFILYHMLKRLQKGHTDDDIGSSYTPDADNNGAERITFADVAGVDTAQVELQEIVSYLSNPKPFLGVGARPPKGLLLHGRPGLGKTLLARAVAGEANADYFTSCSGSDFVEIYVGQGAKRVRQLFNLARNQAIRNWNKTHRKNNAMSFLFGARSVKRFYHSVHGDESAIVRPPTAVIFFDEIDSIAKCRDGIGRGLTNGGIGGNDEREQTLNALLSELDGFTQSDVSVIVIAATNRVSTLDPAILRPGRFDRHVALSPPNASGREAILKIHARNKCLSYDVTLSTIAADEWTYNFTGAELQNVMNEAALLAVRDGSSTICQYHLHQSIERIKAMKSISIYNN